MRPLVLLLSIAIDFGTAFTKTPHRFHVTCSYDGSAFRGWQVQESSNKLESSRTAPLPLPAKTPTKGHTQNSRTVQGVIQSSLRQYFDDPKLFIVGAGRTDRGVHADGQHFHFDSTPPDLPSPLTPSTPPKHDGRYDVVSSEGRDKFLFKMNRMLPTDIRILDVEEVDSDWHVMKSSKWKRYIYSFTTNKIVPPRERHYRTHVYYDLDINLFQEAVALFVGTHDFSAFGCQLEKKRREQPNFSAVRTIHRADVIEEGGGDYKIVFEVNGALYKMIRNIVGVCFDVGAERVELNDAAALLAGGIERDDHKSKPAPAEGLCMGSVFFDEWSTRE